MSDKKIIPEVVALSRGACHGGVFIPEKGRVFPGAISVDNEMKEAGILWQFVDEEGHELFLVMSASDAQKTVNAAKEALATYYVMEAKGEVKH